ncbi:hypothetical protein BD289DRAFT_428783, partial [Coniella lustricola]
MDPCMSLTLAQDVCVCACVCRYVNGQVLVRHILFEELMTGLGLFKASEIQVSGEEGAGERIVGALFFLLLTTSADRTCTHVC